MLNNLIMTKTLVQAGANLSIVNAMGHTPGFYGFIISINFFLFLKHVFFFNLIKAKTREIQLILI